MAMHMGPARFRFYYEGRSHTLICRYCITQIVAAPAVSEAHRGNWSAVGVFENPESATPTTSLLSFRAACAAEPNLEGIFRTEADAARTIISGLVIVTSTLSAVTSDAAAAAATAGLRVVLQGRNAPRVLSVKPKAAAALSSAGSADAWHAETSLRSHS